MVERRLTAILAADVVGYSRLIRADEEGTLVALRAVREELIDPRIEEHRGRIVKLMGDGLLLEFASVVDAVACGAAVQAAMAERNAATPVPQQIVFRVGINLGDVVIDGDDIQGDGVNVAARLEALSEPGGMCISDAVHEQVRDRLDLKFEDSGKQEVKNIDRPVQAWKWFAASTGAASKPNEKGISQSLSEKPSIAVLPFDNMSGDLEQEYFADGVVEDLITALSRMPWLFVIARNSSFIYKGRAVDVKEVGRDLGVRYVLEGSIRKAGGRVRITGQLIDATTGAHLWADRYDGSLDDIFDLQDQVTSSVVGAIAPKLELAEIERAKHKPTSSLDAYDLYLRGLAAFHQWTAEGSEEALNYFYRAIEIDREYAIAHGMAARCMNQRAVVQPSAVGTAEIAEAERLARRAADLGRNDALALCMAGVTLGFVVRDVAGGAALTQRALVLNPNLAAAWYSDGWLNVWLGNSKIGIEHIGRAMQLSPQDPMIFQMQSAMAHAYFTAGDDSEAMVWAQKALHDRPDHLPALAAVAASAAHLGRQADVEDAKARLLRLFPTVDQNYLRNFLPYQQPQDAARWAEGFRMAGLPE
jgi:TolB-like protein/class 3 adenylate cyclase